MLLNDLLYKSTANITKSKNKCICLSSIKKFTTISHCQRPFYINQTIKRLSSFAKSVLLCPSSNHLQTTLIRFGINRTDLCHLTLSLPLVFKFMLHNKFRICKPTNIRALLLLLIIKLPLMHIC